MTSAGRCHGDVTSSMSHHGPSGRGCAADAAAAVVTRCLPAPSPHTEALYTNTHNHSYPILSTERKGGQKGTEGKEEERKRREEERGVGEGNKKGKGGESKGKGKKGRILKGRRGKGRGIEQ